MLTDGNATPMASAGMIDPSRQFLFNQYKKSVDGLVMPTDKDAAQFTCFMLGYVACQREQQESNKPGPGWAATKG